MLESEVSDGMLEIICKDYIKVSVGEPNVTKAERNINILIILYKVLDRKEYCVQGILHHIDAQGCGGSHWHWIGVDASKSFLVDWVLTLGGDYLFLSRVSNQMILQILIHNEGWLQVVNVLSLHSLRENVGFGADGPASNFGQLCLAIKCEATEFLDVDTLSCSHIVLNILNQGLPND